jgi:replication-associated recombination protein RarA
MDLTQELVHLHPGYRKHALLADEERIEWIRSDRYLGYQRADRTLKRLEDLLNYPTRDRMPCMLLFGAPGMGKTKILTKFQRSHPATVNQGTGVTVMPVVAFQMPPEPDEKSFYQEMLKVLNGAYDTASSAQTLRLVARRLISDLGVRMLMIDEVHAMLSGSARQQRIFLNTIRFLTNDLRIPILCAGTEEARVALVRDQQLADRFEALELKGWKNDAALRTLLAGLSAILPLRNPSNLTDPAVGKRILNMTAGNTGRIFRLIETVAVEAIRNGRERLNKDSFNDEDLVLPLVSMVTRAGHSLAR